MNWKKDGIWLFCIPMVCAIGFITGTAIWNLSLFGKFLILALAILFFIKIILKQKTTRSDIPESDAIFSEISTKFDCSFVNATKKDLGKLKKIGLSEILFQFYSSNEPVNCYINGIQIHGIDQVIAENTELCPGWVTAKYGYFVFASNDYGNVFCFDVNTLDDEGNPRIAFVSHEAIWDESTKEEVHESIIPVAKNLYDFLNKLRKGEIEESYDDI